MTTYELIAIFEDTQNKIIQNPFLQEQMMTSKK